MSAEELKQLAEVREMMQAHPGHHALDDRYSLEFDSLTVLGGELRPQ